MEATRGYRELHARYDGDPEGTSSMHDAGPMGRSHLQGAKAAAEARGEYIFAKPDHLGIQVWARGRARALQGSSLLTGGVAAAACQCSGSGIGSGKGVAVWLGFGGWG